MYLMLMYLDVLTSTTMHIMLHFNNIVIFQTMEGGGVNKMMGERRCSDLACAKFKITLSPTPKMISELP